MTLFYGNINNGDSVTNWVVSDSAQGGNMAFAADSSTVISNAYGRAWVGYVFDTAAGDSSSVLQYTNCDAFYGSDSIKVGVNVIFPDTSFNPNNTAVYLILPAINCVMSTIEPQLGGSNYNVTTHTISIVSESNTAIVPAGMSYELVMITIKNGQYYYCKQSGIIPHTGINATAVMTPQTQTYVTAQLAAL